MRVVTNCEYDTLFKNGLLTTGLPSTAQEASRRAIEKKALYPALLRDVESDKVSFVVSGDLVKHAYMGELPKEVQDTGLGEDGSDETKVATVNTPYVKVYIGAGTASFPSSDSLDVPVALLMKQTNTKTNDHALAQLDIAFSLGAVNLFVTVDERLASRGGSPYRAIPVICTSTMFKALERVQTIGESLACLAVLDAYGGYQTDDSGVVLTETVDLVVGDNGEQSLTISTGVDFDGGKLDLSVNVKNETRSDWTAAQSNASLAMTGPGVICTSGYFYSFDIIYPQDPSSNIKSVLFGYISRVATGSTGAKKKRKAISMLME